MTTTLTDQLTHAHRLGATFQLIDGPPGSGAHGARALRVRRPDVRVPELEELLAELRPRRDELVALLGGPCAGCGGGRWIVEEGTGLPWCRPCAGERGWRLLVVESPPVVQRLRAQAMAS